MHTTEQLNNALAGRYVIHRLVGEGGMATVYLAGDVKHHRKVALKVLKPDLGAIVGEDRFLAEIQMTANLQHPNLLPLFDSGVADSLLFYVMPYVDGESLRARLDREKQLPIDDAIRIATAMASALDYAHRQGVIHRDLKPENVLLHEGVPMVADFGIALALRNAGGNRLTQTGLSLGTPQYMSPEQATGDRAIDARTDIYSLGALTYEMLTGEPPHTGSTSQAVIARVLTEKPRSIRASRPSVPLHVEASVEKALEKLPADRWATAREFAEALNGARSVSVTTSESAGGSAATRSSHRVREAIAWVVAASAVAGMGYLATRPRPTPLASFASWFTADMPEGFRPPSSPFKHVAISHDGRRVAVLGTTKSGGRPMIYVRSLDGDPTFAPVRGSERAASITLSPDGEWVAFHVRDNGVFKLPIAGGTPQLVTDSAELPRWEESGDMIVRRLRGGFLLIPADGSKSRALPLDSASAMITSPSLLPGGRDLLAARPSRDGIELVLVSVADGRVTKLDMLGAGPIYSEGRVVFTRSPGLVFSAPFSVAKRKFTGKPTLLMENVGGKSQKELAIAGNGTMVYMGGDDAEPRSIVAVDEAGVETPLSRDDRRYGEPRVSPDGKRVVMRFGESPEAAAVGICDVSSCLPAPFIKDKRSGHAEWSRDGARIITTDNVSPDSTLVQSRRWDGTGGVETLYRGVGSSKEGSVTSTSIGRAHGWSAFQLRNNGYSDILIAPTDSLQALRPLKPAVTGWKPSVSPNGKLLAYSALKSGSMQVFIRPIPTGREIPVSSDPGREPVWSSDGKSLFYRGASRMMVATVAEQPTLQVTKIDSLFVMDTYDYSDAYGGFDVFPDGKRFVMTRLAKTPSGKPPVLNVVLNWPQLLNKERGTRRSADPR